MLDFEGETEVILPGLSNRDVMLLSKAAPPVRINEFPRFGKFPSFV
jgi:hypothetical protein